MAPHSSRTIPDNRRPGSCGPTCEHGWTRPTRRGLLSEWGDPAVVRTGGFHADFFLQFGGPTNGRPLRSLWNNGPGTDTMNGIPTPVTSTRAEAVRPPPSSTPTRCDRRYRRDRAHLTAHVEPRLRPAGLRTPYRRPARRRVHVPVDVANVARRSTTATRSACDTSPTFRTSKAACWAPATTGPVRVLRCNGTTGSAPGSPPPPSDRLYLPIDRDDAHPPSLHSAPTRNRCFTWSGG